MEQMKQKVYEIIKDAEMILIGIGEEFSPEFIDNIDKGGTEELLPYKKSQFYADIDMKHEVVCAYNKLRELVGAKPYFVVTMNTDDLIYKSNLERDLIVAPCGSMQKMQCDEHIVDAKAIREHVLGSAEHGENAEQAVCPICGKPLAFHVIGTEGYLEEGYLGQWSKYTRWLSCTLNRKLCVIELGVGFRFPQVIRFPFEKVAGYNRKASFIRVNSKFPQLPEELSERGVCVSEKPVQFMLRF